jgi:hypothetical protein
MASKQEPRKRRAELMQVSCLEATAKDRILIPMLR